MYNNTYLYGLVVGAGHLLVTQSGFLQLGGRPLVLANETHYEHVFPQQHHLGACYPSFTKSSREKRDCFQLEKLGPLYFYYVNSIFSTLLYF